MPSLRGEIDFSNPDDLSIVRSLCAHADVVISNDADNRLVIHGIDLNEIRKSGDMGLITCRIPAFPKHDPRNNLPPYEALAGMAGFFPSRLDYLPRYTGDTAQAWLVARHRPADKR